ncbi:hypothetical protein MS3_00008097 [Schistosoma haematobium]|uniref:Uncharacterized protein n=1 Tax=Schistosoma haematobium TaxID=6185 RepID=A0A922IQ32_SCHHA|nr:hypothetical protein MS3_00008097 [Schistosoma haematobium]KAH9583806.1 hypothetical protein MS3_00008097 [Schistosoma haematobium]
MVLLRDFIYYYFPHSSIIFLHSSCPFLFSNVNLNVHLPEHPSLHNVITFNECYFSVYFPSHRPTPCYETLIQAFIIFTTTSTPDITLSIFTFYFLCLFMLPIPLLSLSYKLS